MSTDYATIPELDGLVLALLFSIIIIIGESSQGDKSGKRQKVSVSHDLLIFTYLVGSSTKIVIKKNNTSARFEIWKDSTFLLPSIRLDKGKVVCFEFLRFG